MSNRFSYKILIHVLLSIYRQIWFLKCFPLPQKLRWNNKPCTIWSALVSALQFRATNIQCVKYHWGRKRSRKHQAFITYQYLQDHLFWKKYKIFRCSCDICGWSYCYKCGCSCDKYVFLQKLWFFVTIVVGVATIVVGVATIVVDCDNCEHFDNCDHISHTTIFVS